MTKLDKLQQQVNYLFKQYECIKRQGCLCFTEEPSLDFDENTRTLTGTFANGQQATVVIPASGTGGGNNPDLTQLPVFNSRQAAISALGPNSLFRYSTENLDGVPSPFNSIIGTTNT